MISVTVIGSGNVAQHLVDAFAASSDVGLTQLYSRSLPSFTIPDGCSYISDPKDIRESDIFIIAVSDAAIADVTAKITFHNSLVVHTSGSISYTNIAGSDRRGVFYPLQTFSKAKPVDFRTVPICIETEQASDLELLETLAAKISEHVYRIDELQRKALHVAAIFANNFSNHLFAQAAEICQRHNVQFDILKPLILETANKATTLAPKDAQTGPAARNDQNTIQSHLKLLENTDQKKLYELLTNSIQRHDKL
ncbi:MAG: DUF2520 domain-containing protein [Flavobacterium sp.]|nr:DUF2520 domain-containing protein [Flavobacterium sp.]